MRVKLYRAFSWPKTKSCWWSVRYLSWYAFKSHPQRTRVPPDYANQKQICEKNWPIRGCDGTTIFTRESLRPGEPFVLGWQNWRLFTWLHPVIENTEWRAGADVISEDWKNDVFIVIFSNIRILRQKWSLAYFKSSSYSPCLRCPRSPWQVSCVPSKGWIFGKMRVE